MSESVQIIDPTTFKIRQVKNIKGRDHQIPDENGNMQCVACVEFTVVGKRHNWPFWSLRSEFEKMNPDVAIG